MSHNRLIAVTDRTTYEVFAADCLTCVPLPVTPDSKNLSVEISVTGFDVKFDALEIHELKSIWVKAAQ